MSRIDVKNFYVRSSLFGALSIAGAVLNYALYPVLVRILNTHDFGDFAVIVAISNQLLGILLAFNIISIYLVKSQSEATAREHAEIIQKVLIWFFAIATLVVFALSPFLNDLLKVYSLGYFAVLSLILITAIPGVIWTGYLQGHKELIRVGAFNFGAALGKLVFATIFAIMLGTVGGLLGILVGTLLGLLAIWLSPGVKLPSITNLFKASDPEQKRFLMGMKGYFIECIFVVGALSFLQNYNITLAKALFSPETAGLYSGIGILSNALYFLCFLLIWIVLPEIKINNQNINRRVLTTAYKLLAGLTLLVVLAEMAFKDELVKLLLGEVFVSQSNLLIYASLYQLVLVAITLYAFYLLVTRQRKATWLAALTLVSCLGLPAINSATPLVMTQSLLLALLSAAGVFWLSTRLYRLYGRRGLR